jgi:serine/threonine protein kinase
VHFVANVNYPKPNILIDNAGSAVLCDFGLSRIKADIDSRTTVVDSTNIAGSRNWMAPERLTGGILRKHCDVYAFGMVIYEVSGWLVLYSTRGGLNT